MVLSTGPDITGTNLEYKYMPVQLNNHKLQQLIGYNNIVQVTN